MSEAAAAQVVAQAKVNLRLRVLARESSGYHQIETLFLRIALGDTVRVRRTPRDRSLDITGDVDLSAIGPVEKNLAWRAAVQHAQMSEWRGGFAIEIEKRIPIGGGLGGGSADAGGVLRAMNAMTSAPIDAIGWGATLGADVPFLASEAAYAFAWGRGDRLMPLPPPPARDLLLILPDFGISTAEAYGWISESGAPPIAGPVQLEAARLSEWEYIKSISYNDFEDVVAFNVPRLWELIMLLSEQNSGLVRMTGSGSTIVAIPDDAASERGILEGIGPFGARLIRSQTADHVEPVQVIE